MQGVQYCFLLLLILNLEHFWCVFYAQAKCLCRPGDVYVGEPSALCPGFYTHGESVETGLQQPQVVSGLWEEVSQKNTFISLRLCIPQRHFCQSWDTKDCPFWYVNLINIHSIISIVTIKEFLFHRTAYYTGYRQVYNMDLHTVYKCCPGWARMGDEMGCLHSKWYLTCM